MASGCGASGCARSRNRSDRVDAGGCSRLRRRGCTIGFVVRPELCDGRRQHHYTATVKNLTTQPITQVQLYAAQPTGTTYVSGDVDLADPGIELLIPTVVVANGTAKASFVLKANAAPLGTRIDLSGTEIYGSTS